MYSKRNTIALSFVLVALGFLLSWWPLSVIGIIFAAATGRTVTTVILGLLLDLAYGAPIGRLHFLYVPFTLLALLCVIARLIFAKNFFSKSPPDTL